MDKIEVTDSFIRIPNPKFKTDCNDLRTIDIQPDAGIKGIWCVTNKQFKTYLFDKTKWTLKEAKGWVKDNAKSTETETTHISAEVKREKGRMLAVASEGVEDRDGEVLEVEGWDLKAFKRNPVLLWQHNRAPAHNGLPIGTAKNIRITEIGKSRKLVFEPEFDASTEFNRTVQKFYGNGILNTFSVGFIPIERDGNRITKQELLEISAVTVPALSTAEVIQRSKDIGISRTKAMELLGERKEVVPFKSFDIQPEDKEFNDMGAVSRLKKWAAGPDKDKIDLKMYRQGFGWYDASDNANYLGYKFVHHDIVGDDIQTIWRGVISAMTKLLKNSEGIPEEDRKGVYDHLVKHYEEFGKEAPAFKYIENEAMKEIIENVEKEMEDRHYSSIKKHIQFMASEMRKHYEKPVQKTKDNMVVDALAQANTIIRSAIETLGSKSKKKEVKMNG